MPGRLPHLHFGASLFVKRRLRIVFLDHAGCQFPAMIARSTMTAGYSRCSNRGFLFG